MGERTEFGRALSTWVLENSKRSESLADVVGSLIGTAAAEHVFAGRTREEFLKMCAHAYDETKKAFEEMEKRQP